MARTSAAPQDAAGQTAPQREDGPAPAAARGPGRPRNASYDQKILNAAVELLIQNGYAGFTIEGLAARTGVGRPTIYRRWPSKAALATAALDQGIPLASTPDTGNLREDLRAFQRGRVARMSLPAHRPIVSGLVADSVADPALAAAFVAWHLHRREGVDVILQRAVDRGELPPDVDFELANDLLLGPLFTRAVVRGQPLAPGLADQTADIVLAALRAGSLRTSQKHAHDRRERSASPCGPSPGQDHHPQARSRRRSS